MKKLWNGLEKWGHYLLAGLCAAVILLSALWTRNQQFREQPGSLALSDQSQRLADVTASPAPAALIRPVDGPVLTPYSDAPIYDPRTGVWQAHPWLDFAVQPGEPVRAMLPGTVIFSGSGEVTIDHGDGAVTRSTGLGSVSVRVGQTVRAGDVIGQAGLAGASGMNGIFVSVRLQAGGADQDFSDILIDKTP